MCLLLLTTRDSLGKAMLENQSVQSHLLSEIRLGLNITIIQGASIEGRNEWGN